MQTGTPNSTGRPALPFEIHRVCGSKMENTFSLCGIVSPLRIRRSIRLICCTACLRKSAIFLIFQRGSPFATNSRRSASTRPTSSAQALTQVPHFPAINRRFCRFGVGKILILLMWNPGFSMWSHKMTKKSILDSQSGFDFAKMGYVNLIYSFYRIDLSRVWNRFPE